ncbi:hypothetical protein H6F71_22980 [Microcoleus sp. FACHB-61]|nr:hypothetical protein [Microcoleus sp. FACHB-61]
MSNINSDATGVDIIWVDRGDSRHRFLKSVMDSLEWMIQVVLRPQQTQGFVLLKKDGWLNKLFVGSMGIDG